MVLGAEPAAQAGGYGAGCWVPSPLTGSRSGAPLLPLPWSGVDSELWYNCKTIPLPRAPCWPYPSPISHLSVLAVPSLVAFRAVCCGACVARPHLLLPAMPRRGQLARLFCATLSLLPICLSQHRPQSSPAQRAVLRQSLCMRIAAARGWPGLIGALVAADLCAAIGAVLASSCIKPSPPPPSRWMLTAAV